MKGTPEEIYEVLMDSRKHAKLTEARAKISREMGATISENDGYAEGKNVKLVRNKRIAQLWRGSDWPLGVFSKATFALHKIHGGTHMRFHLSGVLDTQYKAIKQG